MVKTTKNHWLLTRNDTFLGKNDQNSCKNLCKKSLIYRWNVQKVIDFNNAKNDVKKWKNDHFHAFLCNFTICVWTKNQIMSIFYMHKTGKNHVKKHVKSRKSRNFQKLLKSSIRLQITFWMAEKIAIDCFDPNPKYEENP